MNFNVSTSPWIPVIYCNGEHAEVDLSMALREAHRIREITDPLPTVEFGLYRLLTTLVHDIFHPKSVTQLG